jgi:SAM-dependent methyltransferase
MNTTESKAVTDTVCPVCGSTTLLPYRLRDNAMCAGCKSFERSRLGYMIIERLFRDQPLRDAVHFAPEPGLARKLRERMGEGYRGFDFDPSRYQFDFMPVEQLDLCQPLDAIAPASQDLVFHNHVLEHLPCDPYDALMRIHSRLRPGGYHVFSLPIMAGKTVEDLNPDLSDEERTARFGQFDHMRKFGRDDLPKKLAELFGRNVHFTESVKFRRTEIQQAGIPLSVLDGHDSSTVYVCRA